jgi:hypothetical protein
MEIAPGRRNDERNRRRASLRPPRGTAIRFEVASIEFSTGGLLDAASAQAARTTGPTLSNSRLSAILNAIGDVLAYGCQVEKFLFADITASCRGSHPNPCLPLRITPFLTFLMAQAIWWWCDNHSAPKLLRERHQQVLDLVCRTYRASSHQAGAFQMVMGLAATARRRER